MSNESGRYLHLRMADKTASSAGSGGSSSTTSQPQRPDYPGNPPDSFGNACSGLGTHLVTRRQMDEYLPKPNDK